MKKILNILSDEDLNALREKSVDVSFVVLENGQFSLDQETLTLVQDLKDLVIKHNGLGMSAIQLGVNKRLFVMRHPYTGNNLLTIVNPKIVESSEKAKNGIEGCFSVPLPNRTFALVSRPTQVTVEYHNEFCENKKQVLDGMSARVFQHELDHLNGKLMIDVDRLNGWSKI